MSSNVDTFGVVPLFKRIPLTLDADWQFAMKLSTDWPEGVTLTFELASGESWAADIDGQWARWLVDKDDTNAVADGTGWKFFARDTDPDVEECWYVGTVVRYDSAVAG